jgi:Rrf2 family iron-sulfur cluster assembly transcriptional regulator
MSLLSRKGLLAIAAVVEVALQTGGRRISARQLAKRLGLHPRSLEFLLRFLVGNGSLRSTRGPNGGYELARASTQVTLSDVLKAIVIGREEEDEPKSEVLKKVVVPLLAPAEQSYRQAIEQITINDMVRYVESKPDSVGREAA